MSFPVLLRVRLMPRMKIFNTLEQATFDTPPAFNSAERKQFFALPLMLQDAMAGRLR